MQEHIQHTLFKEKFDIKFVKAEILHLLQIILISKSPDPDQMHRRVVKRVCERVPEQFACSIAALSPVFHFTVWSQFVNKYDKSVVAFRIIPSIVEFRNSKG